MKKEIQQKLLSWYDLHFTKCLLCIILLVFNFHFLNSQQVILSGGKSENTANGSISYSIGQLVYQTDNNSLFEGIQIPYEIYVVTGIEEESTVYSINVYPNPVVNDLTLIIEEQNPEKCSYQIYDENGRTIFYGKITTNQQNLSFQNFKPGIYYLKVLQSDKSLKTFKIIKK